MILVLSGCGRQPQKPVPAPLPQTSGTLAVEGLTAPVIVTRDRWGVPHITAANQDDLFFAQGFIQAEDRLFQMDLWRRSVQGRLSEVLGLNFVERDEMTRRIQYRGDMAAEWASYGADTRGIAMAFTRGINAWVGRARAQLSEEFLAAGWMPEFWRPEDLLNRTDAFVASGNALDEVLRARLVATLGASRADGVLPPPNGVPTMVPPDTDVSIVTFVLGDALRRVGTAPFFIGLASPVGSNGWAAAPSRTTTGAPLVASDPHRALDNPSLRYLVHLTAPGWNVVGATAPWLPGVAIGHNDHIAWGMTASAADTQDIYVEKVNPDNPGQVAGRDGWTDIVANTDVIAVNGNPSPIEYEQRYTPHGVVIAVDGVRHLAYSLKWSGAEPGAASELAALAIDRARSWTEFREALTRWKMPVADFVYADADGHVGRQLAGLIPVRPGTLGNLPAPAGPLGPVGNDEFEWRGWSPLNDLPHAFDPPIGYVASANDNPARTRRIAEVFVRTRSFGLPEFERLQQDVVSWNAEQIVPLLARLHVDRADVDEARKRLLGWDRRIEVQSGEAALYVSWESELWRELAGRRIPDALLGEFMSRVRSALVPALVKPSRTWFDGDVQNARDALLAATLVAAFDKLKEREHTAVTFAHPLGITDRARERFNIGPFSVPGYADTVMSIARPSADRSVGPSFRAVFDLSDWDRSVAINAPGQSGWPSSPHFGDLAQLWAVGEYFPLVFSKRAVEENTEATLVLTPAPQGRAGTLAYRRQPVPLASGLNPSNNSGRSSAVRIAFTPGMTGAAVVSMRLTRACGIGLRRSSQNSIPSAR